jgi:hypothetical protein
MLSYLKKREAIQTEKSLHFKSTSQEPFLPTVGSTAMSSEKGRKEGRVIDQLQNISNEMRRGGFEIDKRLSSSLYRTKDELQHRLQPFVSWHAIEEA